MRKERMREEPKAKRPKPEDREQERKRPDHPAVESSGIASLQQAVGNRAVQRLLAQRSSTEAGFALDEETAASINRERSGGQPLDGAVQAQAGPALGADFSGVRVHDSPEADALNRQLNAKAFTTGQDIFFREGEYQPNASGGQELIAHELAHVVQQSSGAVGGGGESGMTVNPPGDRFEQAADAAARQAVQPGSGNAQRQEMPEEEEEAIQTRTLQRQEMPEEEEVQTKALQRQELLEEDETAKGPAMVEEEGSTQMPAVEEAEGTVKKEEMGEAAGSAPLPEMEEEEGTAKMPETEEEEEEGSL